MDTADVCVDDAKCLDETVAMRLTVGSQPPRYETVRLLATDPENSGALFIDRQGRAANSWLATTEVLQKLESERF